MLRSTRFVAVVFLTALITTSSLTRAATPTLTGVTVFPSNTAGQWTSGHLWNTEPDQVYWNLFLTDTSPTGPFLNGPSNAQIHPTLPLVPGTYTFGILGERPLPDTGYDPGQAAINLYLNDATTPTISAFALTTPGAPIAALSGSVPDPLGQPTTAANTLSWTDGQYTVTLTDFNWVVNDTTIDRVDAFDAAGVFGAPDLHGTFTLTVVPEPALITFIAAVATPVIARRRRS